MDRLFEIREEISKLQYEIQNAESMYIGSQIAKIELDTGEILKKILIQFQELIEAIEEMN